MADDDDEESGPVVELGEGARVEGMPLARVSSRQTWGMEKSRLAEREADTEIRTPDGPQRLGDVLGSIDTVYFARRQDFEDEVTNVVGTGPVPTANGDEDTDASGTDTEDTADGPDDSGSSGEVAPMSETDSKSNGESDADSDSDSDPNLDPDPDGDAESRATSQGQAHAETSTDPDPDAATDQADERDSEN